jgi:hypothetical protein
MELTLSQAKSSYTIGLSGGVETYRAETMATGMISIEVDEEAARAFSTASVEERQKMQMLLNLRLRELTIRPVRPLREIMDEIGRNAAARGLTPEILDALLSDEQTSNGH